jgi:hypothetical protein
MSGARVSTLAQKNSSAEPTVDSAGTHATITNQSRLIGLEKVGNFVACFLRVVHDRVSRFCRRVLRFSSGIFGCLAYNGISDLDPCGIASQIQ